MGKATTAFNPEGTVLIARYLVDVDFYMVQTHRPSVQTLCRDVQARVSCCYVAFRLPWGFEHSSTLKISNLTVSS